MMITLKNNIFSLNITLNPKKPQIMLLNYHKTNVRNFEFWRGCHGTHNTQPRYAPNAAATSVCPCCEDYHRWLLVLEEPGEEHTCVSETK
jgi:hypothetical protein